MNRHLAATENQTTAIQYLWDTGKAIIRGKSIELQAYLKKEKKNNTNKLQYKSTHKGS